MADHRHLRQPPGHRAARLLVLVVLTAAAAAGARSIGPVAGAGWAVDQGQRAVAVIWRPLLDADRGPVTP